MTTTLHDGSRPSPGLLADLATRPLEYGDDDRCCGLCRRPLTTVAFASHGHEAEVLSCGPCGWHTWQVDGAGATLDDVRDVVRGTAPEVLPRRGHLPATWDRR